jgi:hypothetical protein
MTMTWRYQPVWQEDEAGRRYTLCECHFDDAGLLTGWTEDPAMEPSGETAAELAVDLSRMLADTYKWEPVEFAAMRVGMRFVLAANWEAKNAELNAAKVLR